jgi:hypothetical protein
MTSLLSWQHSVSLQECDKRTSGSWRVKSNVSQKAAVSPFKGEKEDLSSLDHCSWIFYLTLDFFKYYTVRYKVKICHIDCAWKGYPLLRHRTF